MLKNLTLISLKRKEVKRILTKRGYAIIKQYYTLKELEQMKKSLHVKPFINEDYGAQQNHIQSSWKAKKLYSKTYRL